MDFDGFFGIVGGFFLENFKDLLGFLSYFEGFLKFFMEFQRFVRI